MTVDNSRYLAEAARQRSQATYKRAGKAIDQLHRESAPVTFASVADAAGVSRNWLYTTPKIRERIESLRTEPCHVAAPEPPRRPASEHSKDALLELLRSKNRELLHENRELRDELAQAHGLIRARSRSMPDQDEAG